MTPLDFRRPRRVAALAAAVTAATMCAGTSAHANASSPAPRSAVRASARSAPAAATSTVPLITGDTVSVAVRPGADLNRSPYSIHQATGNTGAFQATQDATTGDRFVVPAVATPYLGRQLDRSLFDVSALERDGITGSAQIPVTLTFAPGVVPAAPPGVTFTTVVGSTAQGYLTASSAGSFAAALREQIGADIAAGHPAGTAPLFGGLTSMTLAAAGANTSATHAASPRYPMVFLRLSALDLNGAPADASVDLVNTDSAAKVVAGVPVAGGVGRVAVPTGNYFAITTFAEFDTSGNVTSVRVVLVDDFTVAAAPAVNTLTLDERSATSQISVTTPRPATQDGEMLDFVRYDATGTGIPLGLSLAGGALPLYISPQPAPRVGKLHYVVSWSGVSPSTATAPYQYDVAFPADDGIPADEGFVVRPSQVATVNEHFYTDPANTGQGELQAYNSEPDLLAFGIGAVGNLDNTTYAMPGTLTHYFGTADSGTWEEVFFSPPRIFFDNFSFGDAITYAGGRTYSLDWGHGPLAADVGQNVGPGHYCWGCVAGTTMDLGLDQYRDSDPTHTQYALFNTSHLTITANGASLYDGHSFGAVLDNVPTTPTTYEEVMDTSLLPGFGYSQSTASHTDIVFKYPPAGNYNTLPSGDFCDGESAAIPCQIMPVLALTYGMITDQTNTSHAPIQVMTLNVGHLNYDGFGSHARITSASVSVSFDGGTTWQPAVLAGADGHYVALWQNPKSAQSIDPSLKVTASDAIGGTITQTISNAYTIAGSSS